MASLGQILTDTLIGTFQGQKVQDDTNTLGSTRLAVLRAIRPDAVASVVLPGGVAVGAVGALVAPYVVDRDAATAATAQALAGVLDVARGEVAKLQLEAILAGKLSPDTPISNRVFEQMGMITNLSATLSAVGIAAEVASLGQIDRCTEEVRRYLDASGVTQLTNFGYGQILGEVLGEPMGQELRSVTGHALLGLGDLVTLQYRRPSFDPEKPSWDDDLAAQVARYGLPPEKAEMQLRAGLFYPQVQDWIRFAVRDVFSPSAVALGRYDDAFPSAILPHSRKAGITDEAMKWFWRAHWELPSPNMGYEMLHRGKITEAELDALLRLADYAPGWVDKMIAISYQPLTRVDARRLYGDKIIDRDRYLRAMMDLGYRREDAELFVTWTDQETVTKTKDLTAAQQKKAYALGVLDEAGYRAYLKTEGYDDTEIAELIAIDTAEHEQKKQAQDVKLAQKRYKYHLSTEDELRQELTKAGVKPDEMKRIVDDTIVEKRLGSKLPSKADLLDWLKKGLISSDVCSTRLRALGYSKDDSEMFMMASASSTSQTALE